MILLEGQPIADRMKVELTEKVRALTMTPRLGIVVVGDDSVSEKFISLKEKFARTIGVEIRRYAFPASITTNELRARMNDIVHEARNDGVIVQLPLPSHIDTQSILNTVIPEKDVDVLSARAVGDFQVGKEKVMPPVVRAVVLLFKEYGISVKGKRAVVVGYGRLVGQPLATWLAREGAQVSIIADEVQYDPELLQCADIVISGVGKPRMITGNAIKENVIVVDVGASEVGGVVVGDVDIESVTKKAAYMTPAKGGVGPLTVAVIFENLLTLIGARR